LAHRPIVVAAWTAGRGAQRGPTGPSPPRPGRCWYTARITSRNGTPATSTSSSSSSSSTASGQSGSTSGLAEAGGTSVSRGNDPGGNGHHGAIWSAGGAPPPRFCSGPRSSSRERPRQRSSSHGSVSS
jgi:hypothetical protein